MAFLIDAADYYRALASAIDQARESIILVGWDFHSRARLTRDPQLDEAEDTLAARLERAVKRERRLRVHVLGWDFAPFYWLEREFWPLVRLGSRSHRRIRFRLDAAHPIGASHHQKIAVIDDRLAFCGGLDVTACRWDTQEHAPVDPRRCDPGFGSYGPFHDVQMAVQGEAAAALGALARERWKRATRRRIRAVRGEHAPWPEDLAPDLEQVAVGIARTEPAFRRHPEIREVESLYLASLRAARRWVYIENQYFTSSALAQAIAARLREPEGPEFVIVVPQTCSGWLEEATMGTRRAALIGELRAADRFGRLRVYCPQLPDPATRLIVHSKVMVVDDALARVGSSNLSNRSLGLDTECDLAIESDGDPRLEVAIGGLRDRLLGEHLGCPAGEVARTLAAKGSLICAVEALRGSARTLVPLECESSEWVTSLLPESQLWDPESPALIDSLLLRGSCAPTQDGSRASTWYAAACIAVLIALSGLWMSPLASGLTSERIAAWSEPLQQGPLGALVALAGFALASLLMPVTLLCGAAVLLFGALRGFFIALIGSLLSALLGYLAGKLLWPDLLRRWLGDRVHSLSRALERHGTLAVVATRLVPIAPFTIVNMMAGAARVGLRPFALGTLIGVAPGTLLFALFADQAADAWREPSAVPIAVASALALVVLGSGLVLRRFFHDGGASRSAVRVRRAPDLS